MARWLQGNEALELLGARFDDLADAAGVPITARHTWLQTWADTFRHHEPWIAVVDGPGGSLEGCAVLARRSRGGIIDITNLGRGQSDYACFPVRHAEVADALAAGVAAGLGRLRRPWRLRVEQLPAGDAVARGIAQRVRAAVIEHGDPSPVVDLTPGAPAESYMGKRLRRSVRTGDKRLADDGIEVTVVHERDAQALGAYLPEIETVWRERDRAVGRRSDADNRATLAFFLAGVRRLALNDEVDLTVLLFDGAMAGFAVCLVDGPSYRVWVPRMAPRFAAYGPGHLVNRALLERADALGCTELDWMRGEEPYKLQTATRSLEHEHLAAWSSPAMRSITETARHARTFQAARREAQARRQAAQFSRSAPAPGVEAGDEAGDEVPATP
jgi:CelD/BcsL family acetyltransferase involved in cellulose biosynthesis